jgi:hypothetical protein
MLTREATNWVMVKVPGASALTISTLPEATVNRKFGGCADIIQAVAEQRQFNLRFPKTFPRFVQHAIWRYCSLSGLDVCNGNRIDDSRRCENKDCRVRLMCDRVALR